ncbi:MAG: hypothetical protein KIT72_03920 [Polyangiaceae bacterium]|nr:hypothetical protein [Polyangiaceae bacterium]MCW5789550.1 hypothetical protein [Polyangiaceae bacterium]
MIRKFAFIPFVALAVACGGGGLPEAEAPESPDVEAPEAPEADVPDVEAPEAPEVDEAGGDEEEAAE